MSTNTNLQGIPDASVLEQLANQFFAALPGTPFGQGLQPAQLQPTPVYKDQLLEQGSVDDLQQAPTSLPDPHFAGTGHVPSSVAGSGISPSAKSAATVAGNANPSAEYAAKPYQFAGSAPHQTASVSSLPTSLRHLPFEEEQPFEQALRAALENIQPFASVPQLPVGPGSVTDQSSFYFLPTNGYQPKAADYAGTAAAVSRSKTGISGITAPPFDVNQVKADFPILKTFVNGRRLVWLDNAATTQKPKQVIDRISYFYEHENSNIHRAAHELAARATDAYEAARKKVQLFLNAASPNEIVFVRGATEAINLIAKSWGEQYLQQGDEIIVSHLEHHANIVPWQQLAAKKGLKLKVIPVDDDGQILLDEYVKLLGPKTKLVSFTQVSNALGTVTPAKRITELAHQAGAKVLIDGAQSVSHLRADVRHLDADWFVFSGHKVFGPTGIGVVYGKEALLNETQPWQGGGNMIKDVTFEHTIYHNAPGRFEAGTGNIADAVGLGAAIDYVNRIGIDLIHQYEHALLAYGTKLLKDIPGLRLIGTAADKASVMSFVLDGYKTEEVGAALNREGIAVRSGHHCAQPILRRFGLESTVRPSLAFYNTCADIDALVSAILKLQGSRRVY
jgi:cysteine desulfurase/selenocysteine lyase